MLIWQDSKETWLVLTTLTIDYNDRIVRKNEMVVISFPIMEDSCSRDPNMVLNRKNIIAYVEYQERNGRQVRIVHWGNQSLGIGSLSQDYNRGIYLHRSIKFVREYWARGVMREG